MIRSCIAIRQFVMALILFMYSTHLPLDKMTTISQTVFSDAFSWMKIYEFWLRFHWSLFLMFELTVLQHWIRLWLGAFQATSHYLNQWWTRLLTHLCVTRPQRFHSFVCIYIVYGTQFLCTVSSCNGPVYSYWQWLNVTRACHGRCSLSISLQLVSNYIHDYGNFWGIIFYMGPFW